MAKIHVCEDKNIMGHKWGWYGGHITPRILGQYLFEESSPQSKFVYGRERQGMEGKTGSGRRHHRICSTSFNTTILLQYAPFSNACRPMRFGVIPTYPHLIYFEYGFVFANNCSLWYWLHKWSMIDRDTS